MIVKGSFEDILYVLIGLVWVAFSIYKGSQKKKKAQRPEGEKVKSKSAIEEILGEFLGVKEEEVVYQGDNTNEVHEEFSYDEQDYPQTEATNAPSEVFSSDEKYKEGNFFEEKRVYTSGTKNNDRLKVSTKPELITKRKRPRFNVRKAIIYSEILKKPSY